MCFECVCVCHVFRVRCTQNAAFRSEVLSLFEKHQKYMDVELQQRAVEYLVRDTHMHTHIRTHKVHGCTSRMDVTDAYVTCKAHTNTNL